MWTGDDRAFFYNAVNKESHWVKPEELKGNEAVNTLLANPPNKKKGRATVLRGVENCGCFVQHFTVKNKCFLLVYKLFG